LQREALERRIRTGKTSKVNLEDKEKQRQIKLKERYEFERGREGGYELIFPNEKNDEMNKLYEHFIVKANELWDDFTTGKGKKGVPTHEPPLSKQSTMKQSGGVASAGLTRGNTIGTKKAAATNSAAPKRIIIDKA
jgi:hypothetical protein